MSNPKPEEALHIRTGPMVTIGRISRPEIHGEGCGCLEPDPARVTRFSDDQAGPDGRGAYRYTLWRDLTAHPLAEASPWSTNAGQICAFVGLNPSTATETVDDATIRRCIRFASAWGYGWYLMLNLFAFRATQPEDMKAAVDPIGPENDATLRHWLPRCGCVVAAWSTHGQHMFRQDKILRMCAELQVPLRAFRFNANGTPRHPLYERHTAEPPPLWEFSSSAK